ncbi:hypothetical protein ACQP2F_37220 [Actinoplanes sp. CA-030573]|uniref:hypothetical protein n=1 Tax=Actinoplanes sp. CA-030573 TaxID=3239898 RepID=UPI003D924203
MPIPASFARRLARLPRWLMYALPVVIGLAAGLGYGRFADDPHTATVERLAGTVTWSNAETRLIAFEADGEVRDPLAGDTTYQVTGQWEDAAGTLHGEGFPHCLAGTEADPVSMERRRIELDAVHVDYGGPQRTNIATFVRCAG